MYDYKDVKSTIAHQYIALKHRCNGLVRILDNDRSVYWEGTIKPRPFSREYTVAVRYTLGSFPICVVKKPNLEMLADGREIPHIYSEIPDLPGTALCLYLPNSKTKDNVSEWRPTDSIVETIIPWASLWLTYFEDWLHSDDWQGGGVHLEE